MYLGDPREFVLPVCLWPFPSFDKLVRHGLEMLGKHTLIASPCDFSPNRFQLATFLHCFDLIYIYRSLSLYQCWKLHWLSSRRNFVVAACPRPGWTMKKPRFVTEVSWGLVHSWMLLFQVLLQPRLPSAQTSWSVSRINSYSNRATVNSSRMFNQATIPLHNQSTNQYN